MTTTSTQKNNKNNNLTHENSLINYLINEKRKEKLLQCYVPVQFHTELKKIAVNRGISIKKLVFDELTKLILREGELGKLSSIQNWIETPDYEIAPYFYSSFQVWQSHVKNLTIQAKFDEFKFKVQELEHLCSIYKDPRMRGPTA